MFSTYDIRSSANACKTLVGLSGVDISTWEKFVGHESEYRYTDDLVEYSNASEPPFYRLRATSDFNTLEPPQTQDIVMEP